MSGTMNRKKLKGYFAGKDCKCCAYNESECGCDADWTPKEVYELRLERDEVREKLNTNFAEISNKLIVAIRERDQARAALAHITEAAHAVVDRWEQPAWKDTEPTAAVIYRLRDALGREAE